MKDNYKTNVTKEESSSLCCMELLYLGREIRNEGGLVIASQLPFHEEETNVSVYDHYQLQGHTKYESNSNYTSKCQHV